MKRRDFLITGVSGAAALSFAKPAAASKKLPPCLPIVKKKFFGGDYNGQYVEREITEPLLLCDDKGLLNPATRGWSPKPLIRANLKGHWPRKKRWNCWIWLSPQFHLALIVSDIDYVSFLTLSFTDFTTKKSVEGIAIKRGGAIVMPEEVERAIQFSGGSMEYLNHNEGGDITVSYKGKAMHNVPVEAEFVMKRPAGHESLNIVVPWSNKRFQMNSKHNSLPTEGKVIVGGKTYEMNPQTCHGILDFGRGMWPYRSWWNWGVASGVQDGRLVALNIGDKWTTGTGANENGIFVDGKVTKVMEDLKWTYDNTDWLKPWRVKSQFSDMVDVTLTPFIVNKTSLNAGVMRTKGVNCYGRWNGTLRPKGQKIEIRDIMGWAEEFSHRW